MVEKLLIGLVLAHIICWVVGGTGVRWVRWLALPIISLGILLQVAGHSAWLAAGAVLAEGAVNTLPYGDKTPRGGRGPVCLALGIPAVILNLHLWWAPVYTGLIFIAWFLASRKWNWISWFSAEIAVGFAQGTALVFAVLHP